MFKRLLMAGLLSLSLCCSPFQHIAPKLHERVAWHKFPLVVMIQPDICHLVTNSLNAWNKATNTLLMIPVCHRIDSADVVVAVANEDCQRMGVPSHAAAVTLPQEHNAIVLTCAPIYKYRPDHAVMWDMIFKHEFGHVLGLSHNNRKGSLMYPSIQKENMDLEIGPAEIRAVMEIYHGAK